jgi:hypothetical protein
MSTLELEQPGYELRFESLVDPQRACVFPCDARGQVDMDGLGEQALRRYLYARAVVRKEFRWPLVRPCSTAVPA